MTVGDTMKQGGSALFADNMEVEFDGFSVLQDQEQDAQQVVADLNPAQFNLGMRSSLSLLIWRRFLGRQCLRTTTNPISGAAGSRT